MWTNQIANQLKQQMINNPQQFAQNALRSGQFRNNQFRNNQLMTNALNAVANNDREAMNTIANNVCREHNVSVEDAQKQYRQYYGLN